jgi:hypothetical protein
MAARKKAARKKAAARRTGRSARSGLGATLGRFELPPTLRDYAKQVRGRLDRLERDLARAQVDVRKRAARLLREASHQLGRLEAEGEAGWRRLTAPYRRQLVDLLRRLEKAVEPTRTTRATKVVRKATVRARKAMREAASAIDQPVA